VGGHWSTIVTNRLPGAIIKYCSNLIFNGQRLQSRLAGELAFHAQSRFSLITDYLSYARRGHAVLDEYFIKSEVIK